METTIPRLISDEFSSGGQDHLRNMAYAGLNLVSLLLRSNDDCFHGAQISVQHMQLRWRSAVCVIDTFVTLYGKVFHVGLLSHHQWRLLAPPKLDFCLRCGVLQRHQCETGVLGVVDLKQKKSARF